MAVSDRQLRDFGRRVAGVLDERLSELDGKAGAERWEAFIEGDDGAQRAVARRWPYWVVLVAAPAMILLALVRVVSSPEPPLTFSLDAEEAELGDWLAASAVRDLPVRFSDGSTLELTPTSRARVVSLNPAGAVVALEKGELRTHVVHRENSRWTVRPGPFAIEVTGTRFDTRWDPESQELDVALFEGSVRISGPVTGEGRKLFPGERLVVSVKRGVLRQLPISQPTGVSPQAAPPSGEEGLLAARTEGEPRSAEVKEKGRPMPAHRMGPVAPSTTWTWQDLLEQGDNEEALRLVEEQGFEDVCATAPLADLARLGRAVRLLGKARRAEQVFRVLRSRFPGTPHAAMAAFMLGRAAQQVADHATAIRWLGVYLEEAPAGAFAMEAMGRLIEARVGLAQAQEAQRAARRYLSAYPNGPHEKYARKVLRMATGDSTGR